MQVLLNQLSEICKRYPLNEKVLIAPSYAIGRQITQSLAGQGVGWANLRAETVFRLADRLVSADLLTAGYKFISDEISVLLVEQLCAERLASAGAKSHFGELLLFPGMFISIQRAIAELRLAGYNAQNLPESGFHSSAKFVEMKELLGNYESALSKNKWIDRPGILLKALQYAGEGEHNTDDDRVFVIMPDFPLTQVELDFLCSIVNENLFILKHIRPEGLTVPDRFASGIRELLNACSAKILPVIPVQPSKNAENLKFLFAPGDSKDRFADDSLDITASQGEVNEVRNVFRTIAREDLRCDNVEIIVADFPRYSAIIWEVCKRLEKNIVFNLDENPAGVKFPVTFSDGLPVTYTKPARAALCFLNWLEDDFPVSELCKGLSAGIINFHSGGELNNYKAVRLLRNAGIGWGRERYLQRLDDLIKNYENKQAQSRLECETDREKFLAREQEDIQSVRISIARLLELAPLRSEDGLIDFSAFCNNIKIFIGLFAVPDGELDKDAADSIIHSLGEFSAFFNSKVKIESAIKRLKTMILAQRIHSSIPRAGCIHVSGLHSGGYSSRARTFVLGLDSSRFPGKISEDAILSNDERSALKRRLPSSGALISENLFSFAKSLAGLRGKVTFSFSALDLQQNREMFPSGMVLQAYRLCSGDLTADYSKLKKSLGSPHGFVVQSDAEILTGQDWWLKLLNQKNARARYHNVVLDAFANLKCGEFAMQQRQSNSFTEYDGCVQSASGKFDPRKNPRPISCSRINVMLTCPFKYFFGYILEIKSQKDMERDPSVWLDNLQFGELLHEIFCRFMREITAKGEPPDKEKHLQHIERIAGDTIRKFRETIPVASEIVFNRQHTEIMNALKIFLSIETQFAAQGIEPLFFEVSFGLPHSAGLPPSPVDSNEPVEIEIKPDLKFLLHGKIDRIERIKKSEYRIWDYKTGKFRDDEDKTQTQHILYAIAAEKILRAKIDKNARIVESGYYYPTEKGEAVCDKQTPFNEQEVCSMFNAIFDLMNNGVFFPDIKCSGNPCGYCDYAECCYPEFSKRKKDNTNETKLKPVWRLDL